jgi:hypothetical protein
MRKWHIGAALTIMTAMSAGSIMAQAPGGAGAAGAQPRPDRAARPARPAPADGGIARLLPTGATIVVANVANGVELTATIEGAEQIQALQAQLTRTVERMTQMVERMAQMGDRAQRFVMPGIYGLLLQGKVTMATANLDNGGTLTFTSADAETLKALQTDMPKWVEVATAAQAQLDARRKMTALLKDGKVTIVIVEGEAGVDVKFTTEDPDALATLKAIMPAYIEGLKNPAPTGFMGGRGGQPGGRGGNRGGDRGGNRGGNRGGDRGGRGGQGGAGERAFPEPKPADK